MSLFHVIKYPISNPPTASQLEALPPKLFRRWAMLVGFRPNTYPCIVSRWYEEATHTNTDIQQLKGMIYRMRT